MGERLEFGDRLLRVATLLPVLVFDKIPMSISDNLRIPNRCGALSRDRNVHTLWKKVQRSLERPHAHNDANATPAMSNPCRP